MIMKMVPLCNSTSFMLGLLACFVVQICVADLVVLESTTVNITTPTKGNRSKSSLVSSVRNSLSLPRTCPDFLQVDRSKQVCKYTDCAPTVQDGGVLSDGRNCFECGTTCNNGCGPVDPTLNRLVPEKISGLFNFGEICCIHDHCYLSKFSKTECDEHFYDQMRAQCRKRSVFDPRRWACRAAAKIYYRAIRDSSAGLKAYNDAQERQKAYEQSPACRRGPTAAKCTPTTVDRTVTSSVGYRFDQNMFINRGSFLMTVNGHPQKPIRVTLSYGRGSFTTPFVTTQLRYRFNFSGSSSVISFFVRTTSTSTQHSWFVQVSCPTEK